MLFVGVMSGTSADGVDAALVDFSESGQASTLSFASEAFDAPLRAEILALNQPGGHNELERSAEVSIALAHIYARAIASTLSMARFHAADVRAIGCHGQTVRHRPDRGYTLQLGNPALLAELTHIAVIHPHFTMPFFAILKSHVSF
jgi:anhydro-N-acetylmuramic acid kinase